MIAKEDIKDLDIVDATELASSGTTSYLVLSLISTTSGSKQLLYATNTYLNIGDTPVEAGDIVTIVGSTAADGTYTVNSVIAENIVDVVEAIPTSTGGTSTYKYPAGAKKVGISPTGFVNTSATVLQTALKDIDTVLASHASQHYAAGTQPIIAQNLSSGSASAGKILQASGTGTWNLVDVVSGVAAELNTAASLGESTTTSSTFIRKLRLTTTSLPLGDYILFWSYVTSGSNNNTQVSSRVRKDSATDIFTVLDKAGTAGAQFSNAGHSVQTALSGVHTYDVDYLQAGGSGSAGISQTLLTLWLIDN